MKRWTLLPGLEAHGYAIFEDGPAHRFTFRGADDPGRAYVRLPWFLRVVVQPEGGEDRLDVLDLSDDALEEGERVTAVYRQRAWWHGSREGYGAAYVHVPDADLSRCASNAEWRRYVNEDLALRDWPAFGGGVFACVRTMNRQDHCGPRDLRSMRQFRFQRGDWVAVPNRHGEWRIAGKVVDADAESCTVEGPSGLRTAYVPGEDRISRVRWVGRGRWTLA